MKRRLKPEMEVALMSGAALRTSARVRSPENWGNRRESFQPVLSGTRTEMSA